MLNSPPIFKHQSKISKLCRLKPDISLKILVRYFIKFFRSDDFQASPDYQNSSNNNNSSELVVSNKPSYQTRSHSKVLQKVSTQKIITISWNVLFRDWTLVSVGLRLQPAIQFKEVPMGRGQFRLQRLWFQKKLVYKTEYLLRWAFNLILVALSLTVESYRR